MVVVVIVVMSVMFIGIHNGGVVNGGDGYSASVHVYYGRHTDDAYYTSEATINAMGRHLASHKNYRLISRSILENSLTDLSSLSRNYFIIS